MKILIIGNIGSGKSYLSKKLGDILGYKVFQIDSIVHDDLKGIKRSLDEQIKLINKINRENKDYIIEGVLRDGLDLLLPLSSSIIYLDLNKKILKRRVHFRYWKQKLGLEKVNYKIDKVFLKQMISWVDNYNYDKLKKRLTKYYNKVIILKTKKDVKKLLLAYEESIKY